MYAQAAHVSFLRCARNEMPGFDFTMPLHTMTIGVTITIQQGGCIHHNDTLVLQHLKKTEVQKRKQRWMVSSAWTDVSGGNVSSLHHNLSLLTKCWLWRHLLLDYRPVFQDRLLATSYSCGPHNVIWQQVQHTMETLFWSPFSFFLATQAGQRTLFPHNYLNLLHEFLMLLTAKTS